MAHVDENAVAVPEPLLTTADVARRFAISESMVTKLARAGTLPGLRIGTTWRFVRARVEAYVEALDMAPSAPTQAPPPVAMSSLDISASANGYVPVDFEALRVKGASR